MIIYTNPTCIRCKILKKKLNDNNVFFKEIDVSSLPEVELNELCKISSELPIIKEGEKFIKFQDILKNLK